MAYTDYIILDGKRYKLVEWEPMTNRQRVYRVGLTGLSLGQDFTTSARQPQIWAARLKVFISTPWPDANYGTLANLYVTYQKMTFSFTHFDGVTVHTVGIPVPLKEVLRVPANVEGHCYGVSYIDVQLLKIFT